MIQHHHVVSLSTVSQSRRVRSKMATFPLRREDVIAFSKKMSKWLSYLEEKTKVRRVALPNDRLLSLLFLLFLALYSLRIRSGRRRVRYARHGAASLFGTTDPELTKAGSIFRCVDERLCNGV